MVRFPARSYISCRVHQGGTAQTKQACGDRHTPRKRLTLHLARSDTLNI